MTTFILEQIIHLIIVSPIIFIRLKDKELETLKVVFVFSAFFFTHSILLHLPIEYKALQFVGSQWNWSGKLFAILGSVVFLLLYRKFRLKDYYLTLHQDKSFLKTGALVVSIILAAQSTIALLYSTPKQWNTETILYQLSMPGIDEEIAYRGIMLGLLAKILKPYSKITFLHPAILVSSLLFGLAHALSLSHSYAFSFESLTFLRTLIMGMIWGWLTIKSGSILLALISHNLGNVTNKLIRMR